VKERHLAVPRCGAGPGVPSATTAHAAREPFAQQRGERERAEHGEEHDKPRGHDGTPLHEAGAMPKLLSVAGKPEKRPTMRGT